MNKKRKYAVDVELDRSLYQTFTTAANAISQMYTQALQQHEKIASNSQYALLERLWEFMHSNSNGEVIEVQSIQDFIQEEIKGLASSPHSRNSSLYGQHGLQHLAGDRKHFTTQQAHRRSVPNIPVIQPTQEQQQQGDVNDTLMRVQPDYMQDPFTLSNTQNGFNAWNSSGQGAGQ